MIGKGQSIANTGAGIDYGWNQEKDAEVVFRQHVAGDQSKQVTEEFKLIQEQNHRCQKNTMSFILSPTPEDGKNLSKSQLKELTQRFINEMHLKERQAIAFVHRDKAHTHVHLYVNRIGFDGKAYNDSFIGKRSQVAAENVAKEMGLTTVKEVKLEKELDTIQTRLGIKNIHQKVMENQRLKTIDDYIKAMKAEQVKVIPCINKSNKLQGFRFEYKGINLKGSEVHRSMSGGKLIGELTMNNTLGKHKETAKSVRLLGKSVELSANLAMSMAKKIIKQGIKNVIQTGIGY